MVTKHVSQHSNGFLTNRIHFYCFSEKPDMFTPIGGGIGGAGGALAPPVFADTT